MNKLLSISLTLLLVNYVYSQEETPEKKEPIVTFSGHIRYEAYYDSYESVTSRDGDFYFYPVPQQLNANGDDIKKYSQFTMLSAQSRLRANIKGPDAFGSKINGLMEIDFLGKASGWEQTPRIRHMFMNLDWGKTQLLMGQSWHPIFVTECFPDVLSMGAGLPFNPLSRAPQIKITRQLTDEFEISGAALSHLDFVSSGPVSAQKNGVIPDFHGTIKYKSNDFIVGIISGYKLLKPRITTAANNMTSKKIGSFDVAGFGKITFTKLTLKAYGVYGGNLSAFTMIGGYGAANDPVTNDNYAYSNIMTMGVWGEAIYKIDAIQLGLFTGYSANLGSSKNDYYSLGYARGEDIHNIFRVSPRVAYTSGKIQIGLEYMLTGATYMQLAANGSYDSASIYKPVLNNRIYFAAAYTF